MAQSMIPLGKKRYTVTLTEEHAENLKLFLRQNHTPTNMMSVILDEFVCNFSMHMIPLFRKAQEEGQKVTMGDFFKATFDGIEESARQEKLL
jgi:hypothetical protein